MDKDSLRTAVRNEITNVRTMVKELLAKKIALAQYKEDKQKEGVTSAPSKTRFGAFFERLQQDLTDITAELAVAPTADTARRVRGLLVDVRGKLADMTSGEVKLVLDMLFKLGGAASLRKYSPTSKAHEAQQLIKDSITRFVHENAIKYIGSDLYPATAKEAASVYADFASDKKEDDATNEAKRKKAKAEKQEFDADFNSRKTQDAMRKWFNGFKNQEDLLYVLAAFVVANDLMPTARFGEVKRALLTDRNLVDEAKKLLYEDAVHYGNSANAYITQMVPEIKEYERDNP
jgi:hypothetical protein